MAYYYFDTETFSQGPAPDPATDKIITIQFQELDQSTGQPEGELTILKEWEESEEKILRKFAPLLRPWSFVPDGNNLAFDKRFLTARCATHGIALHSMDEMPLIDLKSLFVILNRGNFKGSGMHNFTAKKTSGAVVGQYYAAKEYGKIETYIKEEAEAFIQFYQRCCTELPRVLRVQE